MRLVSAMICIATTLVAATAAFAGGIPSPDPARSWFNLHAAAFVLVFGLVWKYAPAFKNYTNDLIGWLGFVLYVLTTIVGGALPGPAAAAAASVTGAAAHQPFLTTVAHGIGGVAGAFATFETLVRPLLGFLGVRKPV